MEGVGQDSKLSIFESENINPVFINRVKDRKIVFGHQSCF